MDYSSALIGESGLPFPCGCGKDSDTVVQDVRSLQSGYHRYCVACLACAKEIEEGYRSLKIVYHCSKTDGIEYVVQRSL